MEELSLKVLSQFLGGQTIDQVALFEVLAPLHLMLDSLHADLLGIQIEVLEELDGSILVLVPVWVSNRVVNDVSSLLNGDATKQSLLLVKNHVNHFTEVKSVQEVWEKHSNHQIEVAHDFH